MPVWALVLLCAAVPAAWAFAVARVVRSREAKKTHFHPDARPPSDYSI